MRQSLPPQQPTSPFFTLGVPTVPASRGPVVRRIA
jgi:hypothetical protein